MSAPAKALVLVAAVAAVAGAAELCASFGDALPQQAADGDVLLRPDMRLGREKVHFLFIIRMKWGIAACLKRQTGR